MAKDADNEFDHSGVLHSATELKSNLMWNMKSNTLLRNLKNASVAIATAALFSLSTFAGPTVLHSAINPANGHVYYLLSSSDWPSSENAAIGLGGHLATIRSLAENNWVVST